jgi:hypothetical protein
MIRPYPSRRGVLRGLFNGTAIAVSIPFLDCFLNDTGTALAAGAPLPTRFGTWFWGLGVTESRWKPTKVGADYDIPFELRPIEAYKDKISILSGFNVFLDGKTNIPHVSGGIGIRTGIAPSSNGLPAPSFDVLIADKIGANSRFRAIDLSATRDARNSLSGRGAGNLNPSESSPLELYARIFGSGFTDPNSADFAPDPLIMARKSVLSNVTEQRQALEARVGARDRERLDQYFTVIRQTEQQLAIQLEKPAPLEACTIPGEGKDTTPAGNEIGQVVTNHKTLAQLLSIALACDQTRVFNMNFNSGASSLTKAGSTISHHQLTHEEQVDPKLGYQPESTWFVERCIEAFGTFVDVIGSFKEGDATLLDNTLVVAHSETNYAKTHTVEGIPIMLAGRAGGRVKSGLHIAGGGTPISRVGLTVQQVLGLPLDAWGQGGNRTNKTITELLA